MKTGRDVVVAALLGAEEYGFGTASLIAEGCVMARQCHLNTCPVGITTHDPKLREKYVGTPERVIHFFNGVAMEVREILGQLGFKSLDQIIGRVDLLKIKNIPDHPKSRYVELGAILHNPDPEGKKPRRCLQARNDPPEEPLDHKIIQDVREALAGQRSLKLAYSIRNVNRSVGARVAGQIAKQYGDGGLPQGIEIECTFHGSAGQSFGAFLVPGMRWILHGEANDYVGKGMTGGEIAVRPPPKSTFASGENVIAGNTILYGATGGGVYLSGRAGERFCVRNSGAKAVVEGVGDHGCEYMTGGIVVVLGPIGRNFGAGMSGGVVFILDTEKEIVHRINGELVAISPLTSEEEIKTLRTMVQRHLQLTGSPLAERILKKWHRYLPLFRTIHPKELSVVQHLTAVAGFTDEPADEITPARA